MRTNFESNGRRGAKSPGFEQLENPIKLDEKSAARVPESVLCCRNPGAISGRNPAPQFEAGLIDYYWGPESGLELRPESGLDLRPDSGA